MSWKRQGFLLMLAIGLMVGCTGPGGVSSPTVSETIEEGAEMLTLSSTAFETGQSIPRHYTCDGENVSIPLAWGDPPAGTQSFALIVDDPDAPMGTWVHWVLYNMSPDLRELPEGVTAKAGFPAGALAGKTSSRTLEYGGPCPPNGTHRYYFKLYALDTKLNLAAGVTADELRKAMEGHILAQAELMGTYHR